LARRILIAGEELGGLHDLARLAIAALRYLLGDPGLLQGMAAVGRQPFDGGDRLAFDELDRHRAGAHRLAVDMDRAGPAGGNAAAELGAGELQVLAQDPQERRIAIQCDFLALSIDRECNHLAPPWLRSLRVEVES